VLVALLVSGAALFATVLIGLITVVYGGGGSDTSEPPPEGSTGDLLCSGPAMGLHLALGGVAVIAPLLALSPWPRRLSLRIGCAVSAGAILLMSVVGEAITSDGLFVLPALVVFSVAVVLAVRPRQGSGGAAL
jgi:hypothetical protein